MELILGQYPYQDIEQHLLVGEMQAIDKKLGSCLPYMEHYTLIQMQTDCIYPEKKEDEV